MEDILLIYAAPAFLFGAYFNWKFANYALSCVAATLPSLLLWEWLTGFTNEGYGARAFMILMVAPFSFLSGIPFALWRARSCDRLSRLCWVALAAGWGYLVLHGLYAFSQGGDLLFDILLEIGCLAASVLLSLRMAVLQRRTLSIDAKVNPQSS